MAVDKTRKIQFNRKYDSINAHVSIPFHVASIYACWKIYKPSFIFAAVSSYLFIFFWFFFWWNLFAFHFEDATISNKRYCLFDVVMNRLGRRVNAFPFKCNWKSDCVTLVKRMRFCVLCIAWAFHFPFGRNKICLFIIYIVIVR